MVNELLDDGDVDGISGAVVGGCHDADHVLILEKEPRMKEKS